MNSQENTSKHVSNTCSQPGDWGQKGISCWWVGREQGTTSNLGRNSIWGPSGGHHSRGDVHQTSRKVVTPFHFVAIEHPTHPPKPNPPPNSPTPPPNPPPATQPTPQPKPPSTPPAQPSALSFRRTGGRMPPTTTASESGEAPRWTRPPARRASESSAFQNGVRARASVCVCVYFLGGSQPSGCLAFQTFSV